MEENKGNSDIFAQLAGGEVKAAKVKKTRGRKAKPAQAAESQLIETPFGQITRQEADRINREWLSVENDVIWTEM